MLAPNYLATFVQEVDELLEQIESALLRLESHPDEAELIHQLFRAFHTLKGSAGVAGVRSIASFTHHVESALSQVRDGTIALSGEIVSAVLASKDFVAALLASELGTATSDPATGEAIVAQLAALTGGHRAIAAAPPRDVPLPPATVDYLVEFAPRAEIAESAVDPDAFIRDLTALGECVVLAPPTRGPDDAGAWPTWKFLVTTARDANAIRDVFMFVESAGALTVEQGASGFDDVAPEPEAVPEPSPAAPARPPRAAAAAQRASSTVRVSSERLDALVQLIGELVITQSRLQQAHSMRPSAELSGPVESFERLITDLRDGVLGLRMVPVGTMFTRFHRLVRDLSAELDKEVQLVTEGDDTELDKSMIDQLGDALVHILRNSLDHGLERPDARAAAGKPRQGTLRIAATHEGTHVVITITDDGRGVDRVAVRAKAIAQGLITADEVLSDAETLALITRPGFSTASAVTELSGRGVGMDVVKRSVESLRGTLTITSEPGRGTAIRLALPLTLAIIDGLLVEIDRDRFIIPMAAVTENVELTEVERRAHNGRNAVVLRGELVPYIRLRDVFDVRTEPSPIELVVVVSVEGQRVGLVVDRVIGSHQTVIQPLGAFYRGLELFSGTTIMGDGRVAMIVDLAGTVRAAHGRGGSTSHHGQRYVA